MILHGKFRKVRPGMGGKIAHVPTFTALIKLHGIIWRFLDAPAKIVTKLKAKVSSSHGENGSFTESIQLYRQANASHHTAKATAAGKSVQGKLLANFVSYRRAALVYVKRIETGLLGELQSATGKVATSIRNTVMRLLALLVSAAVKILHLGNMIWMAAASKLDTSGTKSVTAARAMKNGTGINPANVVGVTMNVSPAAATAHIATLTTFAEPEPGADDVLPEQQLEFKDENDATGCYYASATLNVTLTEGVTYTVSWDGQLYKCVARKMGIKNYFATYRMTALGDPKNYPFFLGSSYPNTPVDDEVGGKGEPFFIHISPGKTSVKIRTLDTSATHTVRIYVEQ